MKLIDADALLTQIAEDSRGKEGWYGDTWEFINTIKDAPTIDAVPVVRCLKCKYYEIENVFGLPHGICRGIVYVEQDGFCKWAVKRKEGLNYGSAMQMQGVFKRIRILLSRGKENQ